MMVWALRVTRTCGLSEQFTSEMVPTIEYTCPSAGLGAEAEGGALSGSVLRGAVTVAGLSSGSVLRTIRGVAGTAESLGAADALSPGGGGGGAVGRICADAWPPARDVLAEEFDACAGLAEASWGCFTSTARSLTSD